MNTEVTAGLMVAGGDCLVRRPGEKVLFVEGAIPGESVSVEVTQTRKDLERGRVTEVVEPSPMRITPPCPVFRAGCGGCQWQYAQTEAQSEFKVDIVRDALTRIAKLPDVPIRFAGAVPSAGYRTTMCLSVVNGQAALHRRNSHDLVALDTCVIAHPAMEELIREGVFGDASQVLLRVSVSTGQRIAVITGDVSGVVLPDDVTVTSGHATIYEDVAERRYRISSDSFFQSGQAAAELLAKVVDDVVPDNVQWIVDAYAGVGVLGSVVAAWRGSRLSAVEQATSAVQDARHNLADLDAEVIEAEVAKVSFGGKYAPDVVIADPSRTGLGSSATKALTDLGAETFVLVSCDPASLARDTTLLHRAGYLLDKVNVLDLFPHTHHVETVSLFKLVEHVS